MGRRIVLKGSKISNRHSTYTPFAGRIILTLKADPSVKKVILGPIARVAGSVRRLKVTPTDGTVRVQVRDVCSVQTLYVVGPTSDQVEKLIEGQI